MATCFHTDPVPRRLTRFLWVLAEAKSLRQADGYFAVIKGR